MRLIVDKLRIEYWLKILAVTVILILTVYSYGITEEDSQISSNQESVEKTIDIEKATDADFLYKDIKVKSKKVARIKDDIPLEMPTIKNPEKEKKAWEITYWWDRANWPAQPSYTEGLGISLCSPQWITADRFIKSKNQMNTAVQANEDWKAFIAGNWKQNLVFVGFFSYRPLRDLQQMAGVEWNVFLLTENGKRIPAKKTDIDFANKVYVPGSFQSGVYVGNTYVRGVLEEAYYYVPCTFVFDSTDDKGCRLIDSKSKSISLCLASSLCQVRLEWQFKK